MRRSSICFGRKAEDLAEQLGGMGAHQWRGVVLDGRRRAE
jgi:hypothetical protein